MCIRDRDKQNRKTLEYVNVSVPGRSVGTVTNADGEFSLKIEDAEMVFALEISHIGYHNNRAVSYTHLDVYKRQMHNVSHTSHSFIIADVFKYKGLIVGCPTYNTQMYPRCV